MNRSITIICAFVLFSFSTVRSTEICGFNDLVCMTKAAKTVYKTLLIGERGYKSLEPLVLENISGRIQDFKYVLKNASLSPMKNCDPSITYVGESSYIYILQCSQLILRANVVAKGRIGPIEVDGSDVVTITADDYTMTVKTSYRIINSTDGQSAYFELTKSNFTVDTECKRNITLQTVNSFGLTEKQAVLAEEYFKNNWKELENVFRYPIVTEFVSEIIFNRIGPYLRDISMGKLIPKQNKTSPEMA